MVVVCSELVEKKHREVEDEELRTEPGTDGTNIEESESNVNPWRRGSYHHDLRVADVENDVDEMA